MSHVELLESSDRWEVPLEGCSVTRCCIDYAVTFTIADAGEAFEIRIEEPFEVHRAGDDAIVEPGGDPVGMAPALALLHAEVEKAVAFRDGRLLLRFLDGAEVLISASEEFEPWTLVGPGGLRLVSMPGGEIAVWTPENG